MRWQDLRRSSNVEERGGIPGGVGGFRIGGGGMSGLGLVGLLLLGYFFGIDPSILLQEIDPGSSYTETAPRPKSPAEKELRDFVSAVLGSTEDTWRDILRRSGRTYEEPHLVIYSGAVQSACGFGQAAMGPFYCPPDRRVYIDLAFYDDLRRRFNSPGDFAQAYVVAHEVGHHVQNLLGIFERVRNSQQRNPGSANALSVRLELQADCFAGLWAHHADRAKPILEEGDVEEALNAASAIGDDRLQRQTQGHVTPDSFTHGTSAQRVRWFRQGLESGTLQACDTFSASRL
jgi:predicted metalloprotease